jgi:hypothetical protein
LKKFALEKYDMGDALVSLNWSLAANDRQAIRRAALPPILAYPRPLEPGQGPTRRGNRLFEEAQRSLVGLEFRARLSREQRIVEPGE